MLLSLFVLLQQCLMHTVQKVQQLQQRWGHLVTWQDQHCTLADQQQQQ
jgi:hypothetical protein